MVFPHKTNDSHGVQNLTAIEAECSRQGKPDVPRQWSPRRRFIIGPPEAKVQPLCLTSTIRMRQKGQWSKWELPQINIFLSMKGDFRNKAGPLEAPFNLSSDNANYTVDDHSFMCERKRECIHPPPRFLHLCKCSNRGCMKGCERSSPPKNHPIGMINL